MVMKNCSLNLIQFNISAFILVPINFKDLTDQTNDTKVESEEALTINGIFSIFLLYAKLSNEHFRLKPEF